MQCICSCFVPQQTMFQSIVPTSTIPALTCLICSQPIESICVSCRTCRSIIGHENCVRSYVQRRGSCPNCKQNTVLANDGKFQENHTAFSQKAPSIAGYKTDQNGTF